MHVQPARARTISHYCFNNGGCLLLLQADTVVAVWKYHNTGEPQPPRLDATPTWQGELYNVTKAGFQAVVSR